MECNQALKVVYEEFIMLHATVPTREQINTVLDNYATELQHCITDEQWDTLLVVLDKRQAYFEQLFTEVDPFSIEGLDTLIEQVLTEDQHLLALVMQRKADNERQRLELARNRQAVKAYQTN